MAMTFLRPLFCLFVVLATTFSTVQAQPFSEVSAPHRAAVARMMNAMQFDELTMVGIKRAIENSQEGGPQNAKFLRELFEDVTPQQIMEKVTPVYAKYYSQEDAQTLANFFSGPTGTKLIRAMVNEVKAGKKPTGQTAQFTPADHQALTLFGQHPATLKMSAVQTKINEESGVVLREWGAEIALNKFRQVLAPINPHSAEASAAPAAAGGGFFSQLSHIISDLAQRSNENKARFQSNLQQLQIETVLRPTKLTTADGIAEGKRKVQRFNEILDQLLRTSDEISQDARKRLSALDLPPTYKVEFMKGIELGMSREIDETIRFGEIERNLAQLMQRTLEFAEAKKDKISERDGKLLFVEQADLDTYRSLIAQIELESAKEAALLKESNERLKKLRQSALFK
jgi:uncharacterized protein YlaN (UPF0358 family)